MKNRELWLALFAIILITLLYLGVVFRFGSIPAAQGFFGHSLGVLGFLFMLMTEILYSIRKRSRSARWGKMANWLQFHIFTGLVGPYLVFLHTAWNFKGLAGIVMLLTAIIVLSGLIGRYIYTAVPRTADGVELHANEINSYIRQVEEELASWKAKQETMPVQSFNPSLASLPAFNSSNPMTIFGRLFSEWSFQLTAWRQQRLQSAPLRAQTAELNSLLKQRREMYRQLASLATARKFLAIWHSVHIPIGVALFTAAFIHIAAAIYYATLLH